MNFLDCFELLEEGAEFGVDDESKAAGGNTTTPFDIKNFSNDLSNAVGGDGPGAVEVAYANAQSIQSNNNTDTSGNP